VTEVRHRIEPRALGHCWRFSVVGQLLAAPAGRPKGSCAAEIEKLAAREVEAPDHGLAGALRVCDGGALAP